MKTVKKSSQVRKHVNLASSISTSKLEINLPLLKTEFSAEPLTKNLEGDSYSINSATIFFKIPRNG